MPDYWSFYAAGQLTFGRGAIQQLGSLARSRGWRRLLVITDRRLREAELVDAVCGPLQAARITCEVFDEGEAEPSLEVAVRAVQAARAAHPDAILGLGGGSNMDLAKITAVVHAHGGTPRDYFGYDRVPGPVAPLVCVPTTSGTGSEVSHAAVLTDTAHHMKVSTLSQHLRPNLAVVDPALTDRCPRQVTADSGIDALTHAIEAFTATHYQDLDLGTGESIGYEGSYLLTDTIAERAIELVGRHLVRVVEHPDDRAARDGMSLAATLAGIAFSNAGVALVHALEYPVGGAVHCSHGAGNGLLLPYVMRFNLPHRQEKLARIATLLGADVQGLSAEASAERGIAAVETIRTAIGIPGRLRELGVQPTQLPEFAEKAYAIRRLRTVNPRPATQADLLNILEAAY